MEHRILDNAFLDDLTNYTLLFILPANIQLVYFVLPTLSLSPHRDAPNIRLRSTRAAKLQSILRESLPWSI